MISFDEATKENIKEHSSNLSKIPNDPYRVLIIGESGSGKANSLFNLITQQKDIDKNFFIWKILLKQSLNF